MIVLLRTFPPLLLWVELEVSDVWGHPKRHVVAPGVGDPIPVRELTFLERDMEPPFEPSAAPEEVKWTQQRMASTNQSQHRHITVTAQSPHRHSTVTAQSVTRHRAQHRARKHQSACNKHGRGEDQVIWRARGGVEPRNPRERTKLNVEVAVQCHYKLLCLGPGVPTRTVAEVGT